MLKTLVLTYQGQVLETSELSGFKPLKGMKKICQIAAGTISGAIDFDGNMYTWGLGDAVYHEHGSLADICVGGQGEGTGLARDRKG
jgi:alpha-tubulin suppressor-like RCC1 family protein